MATRDDPRARRARNRVRGRRLQCGTAGVAVAALLTVAACGQPPPPPVRVAPNSTLTHLSELAAMTDGGGPAPVALTFDDGPDPRFTPQILDVLDRHGVRATFFVQGHQVQRYPWLARAIVDRGHAIANHGWDHAAMTKLSTPALDAQIHRTSDAIVRATGQRPTCVRPPYGAIDGRVAGRVWASVHVPVTWTVDPFDWRRPGAAAIFTRVMSKVTPGGVVLLHDGGGDRSQTVAVLPFLIEALRQRGMTFVRTCIPFDLTPRPVTSSPESPPAAA